MKRPLGLTILGVLAILAGVFGIVGWIGTVVSLVALLSGNISGAVGLAGTSIVGQLLLVWFGVLGVAEIVFGVGVLRLRGWAWTLGVGLMATSIVSTLALFFLGGHAINISDLGFEIVPPVAILVYLFTRHVQAAFGKSGVGPTFPPLNMGGPTSQAPPSGGGYTPPTMPVHFEGPSNPEPPNTDIPTRR